MTQNFTIKNFRLWALLLAALFPGLMKAQQAAQYGYSTLTGTYTNVTGGTSIPGILFDDATQTNIPIGFTFTFCGTSYTTLSACSNGFASLSNTTSTTFSNAQSSVAGAGFLMPYWDDGYGASTGAAASYITTGTAPNRVFTIEWKNWGYCCATTTYQSYQVKLYETTNVIEFWYQPIAANSSRSATIGIANSTTDWQTLDGVSSTAVSSTTVFNVSIPNQPDSGRIFRYTPPAPCTGAPTITSISPATPVSVCQGASVNYVAQLPPALNVAYQWSSATSCAGPWTPITNATNYYYTTAPITGSIFYHLVATCTTSNQSTTSACQQVSPPGLFPAGIYTINAALPTGGTNYHSFGDAVNAIACGIAGPVVFNVVAGSGPYNEQVVVPYIYNASAINTVTFNGNGETLTYNNNNSNNYGIFTLNGADYIKIKKLTIAPAATGSYGFAVVLTNDADNNLIDSCKLTIPLTVTTSYAAGVVFNTGLTYQYYASTCDSNTISNNTITGGYYGVFVYGSSSTSPLERNTIVNNKIHDFYVYGIYAYYTRHFTIAGNNIARPTRTTLSTFYGIYSYYGGDSLQILKNKIHTPFGTSPTNTSYYTYALSAYYIGAAASAPAEISNNAIYDIRSNYYIYAFRKYDYYSSYTRIAYNTISLDDTASTATGITYGFYHYQYNTGATIFRNNLISIRRGGTGTKYLIYMANAGSLNANYNDYYLGSTAGTNYMAYNAGTTQTTLAAWKTASGVDTNTLNLNPRFDGSFVDSLYPTNDTLDNMCLPIAGITTDNINVTRSATTPDVGAFEFARKCSGPANPGVVLTSDTGMCPGYIFTLTDTTYEKGVSWLNRTWQQSTNNGNTWSNVANGTNKDTIQRVFPTTTMYYRLRMLCMVTGDTTYSNTVKITLKPPYKCYCYSMATGGGSDTSDIGAFSIGSFSTNVGGPHVLNPVAVKGRTDYTDYGPIVLYKDSTYTVNVYHTMRSLKAHDALVTMFMDYNNNLIYDYNTNESVTLKTTNNSAKSWTSSDPNQWYLINKVTIPHAVITNVPTGLRLVLNSNTDSLQSNNPQSYTACGAYTSGETEDYVVIFKERYPTGVNNIAGVDQFVVYPNPNNGLFSVSFKAQQQLSDVQLIVTDITGRVIESVSYGDVSGSFLKSIDLSQQAKGIYLVELKADSQKIFEKVMVK